jgi:hypothetical protein
LTKSLPVFLFCHDQPSKALGSKAHPTTTNTKNCYTKKRVSKHPYKENQEVNKEARGVSPPMTSVIFGSGFRGSWPLGL